jgi:hypothetical protein
MPRRLVRNYTSHSQAALFLKTLRGVPTPWSTTSWLEDGEPKEVRFRLWVRRRGHTLHVETHKDSPSYAGRSLPVLLQRQGLLEMHTAGLLLVDMAMLDPTSIPAQPRFHWNKSHRNFLNGKAYLYTVASHLYKFLNPKRGRPRNPPVIGDASVPGHPVGMRLARRKELLTTTDKMLNALQPMLDRAHDARRMRGYTKDQRDEIYSRLDRIYREVRMLRSAVFNDAFETKLAEVRKLSTEQILGLKPVAQSDNSDWPSPAAPPASMPFTPTPDTLVGFELPSNL